MAEPPACSYSMWDSCPEPATTIAVWIQVGEPEVEYRTPVCARHLTFVNNAAHVVREEPVPTAEGRG